VGARIHTGMLVALAACTSTGSSEVDPPTFDPEPLPVYEPPAPAPVEFDLRGREPTARCDAGRLGNVWEIVATDDGHVRRGGGWDSWFGPSPSERMTLSQAYMDTTGFRCVRPTKAD
jgi:hypothetical protein